MACQKYWSVVCVQWFLNNLFKNHCTCATLQYFCLANFNFTINKSRDLMKNGWIAEQSTRVTQDYYSVPCILLHIMFSYFIFVCKFLIPFYYHSQSSHCKWIRYGPLHLKFFNLIISSHFVYLLNNSIF